MTLEELILQYENEFFKKEFCNNIKNLDNRIHDKFIEFGSSGKVYDKNTIIKYLNALDKDRDIKIVSFKIKEIKDNLIIANYISCKEELQALRTSIWIRDMTDWKLYFHQGTETSQGDALIYSSKSSETSRELDERTANANVILSNRAKRQLKRYGFEDYEFLKAASIEDLANEESNRKHSIIFPIYLGGKKYIVSGKKHKTTITVERIEINHITI